MSQRTRDPKAYLEAVDLAWRMGLHDAVFMRHDVLEGERLGAMLEWLDALGFALPKKASRETADALRAKLAAKPRWKREGFRRQLEAHGIREPTERDWQRDRACAPRGPASAGAGGYPCALWLLFHTLLANSDRRAAPHVLDAIRAFVVTFFGCTDCAQHFAQLWRDADGAAAQNAVDASIWLWKAHNAVTNRLMDEDPDAAPFKDIWPSKQDCETCHTKDEDLAKLKPFDEDYVFYWLQETFCFNSDTFTCAAFDDPSVDAKLRT